MLTQSETSWFSRNWQCINSSLSSMRSSKVEHTCATTTTGKVWRLQITPLDAKLWIWFCSARILNNIQMLRSGWHISCEPMLLSITYTVNYSKHFQRRTVLIHSTITIHLKCSFRLDNQSILIKSITSSTLGSSIMSGTATITQAASR